MNDCVYGLKELKSEIDELREDLFYLSDFLEDLSSKLDLRIENLEWRKRRESYLDKFKMR